MNCALVKCMETIVIISNVDTSLVRLLHNIICVTEYWLVFPQLSSLKVIGPLELRTRPCKKQYSYDFYRRYGRSLGSAIEGWQSDHPGEGSGQAEETGDSDYHTSRCACMHECVHVPLLERYKWLVTSLVVKMVRSVKSLKFVSKPFMNFEHLKNKALVRINLSKGAYICFCVNVRLFYL